MLFLDEPTTGLDSTTGREIVRDIQALGRDQKLVVVMTLHQPSFQIIENFDLLLLVTRGVVCYFGPNQEAPGYFASLGHVTDSNPAELYCAWRPRPPRARALTRGRRPQPRP